MQQENHSNEETIDLTTTFPQNLQDGEHRIYESDGITLFAIVSGGRITWRAKDSHGHDLTVSTGTWENRCWVCVKLYSRTGECRVFVPCYTIAN